MSSPATETPEQLVQRQVEAYNQRDLEAFLATYHEDIELFHFPDQLILNGMPALRERYRNRFQSTGLHAHIHARMVVGNTVLDHESVTGSMDVANQAIAIYQVEDDRIRRVFFIV